MGAPYSGSCNCGAVTATIDAEPAWVRQCWCRQCQKAASGSATTNALFPSDAIKLTGEVRWNGYIAESRNTIEQGFCPNCGTQIFGRNSARLGALVVRLGFIDPPHDLRPSSTIWLDEAPDWAKDGGTVELFPRQPPPPPAS